MKKLNFVEVPTVPLVAHKRRVLSQNWTNYSDLDRALHLLEYEGKICVEIEDKRTANNIRGHVNSLSTTTTRYSCAADYANGKMYIVKWKFEP